MAILKYLKFFIKIIFGQTFIKLLLKGAHLFYKALKSYQSMQTYPLVCASDWLRGQTIGPD